MTENIFNKFTRLFMSSLDSMMSANIWHDPFTYFTEKPICSQEFQFACSNILVSEVRRLGLRNPKSHVCPFQLFSGCTTPANRIPPTHSRVCLLQCSMDSDIKATKHSLLGRSGQSVKYSMLQFKSVHVQLFTLFVLNSINIEIWQAWNVFWCLTLMKQLVR